MAPDHHVSGSGPVAITTDSVGKTIAGAKIKGQGNDLVVDTSSFYKPTQTGAYPIVEATYEIVCSKYPDSATGAAVKAFMQATIGPGQDGLDQYGYIPLPSSIQSKLSSGSECISLRCEGSSTVSDSEPGSRGGRGSGPTGWCGCWAAGGWARSTRPRTPASAGWWRSS